ncbi:uncharacterized protein LOC132738555 [Ruditapes philippinarum]|uniref:uncharacterized protein LOC132738555 n=1 Tax=Ruditapes philippinarum TaxID=129788 RepID=UPI00295B6601|nr:uncharacterized protein LOC132738555 [Ruditapes philippinarum]
MVVGTIAAVTVVSIGAANIKPIAAGATAGQSFGSKASGAERGSAVKKAVCVGTAAGAIAGATAVAMAGTGAGAGTIASGALMGGLAGGTAAAGMGGVNVGVDSLFANTRMSTDDWVLLTVGASVNQEDDEISYDCWKPVVHDTSPERSNGILLKDMVCHPNVANVTMTTGICDSLPSILIENIWNETFEIEYVFIHNTGKIVCHAKHL